ETWSIEDLRARAEAAASAGEPGYTVLMRLDDPMAMPLPRVLADFMLAGFELEILPTQTRFAMEQGASDIRAIRIYPASGGGTVQRAVDVWPLLLDDDPA